MNKVYVVHLFTDRELEDDSDVRLFGVFSSVSLVLQALDNYCLSKFGSIGVQRFWNKPDRYELFYYSIPHNCGDDWFDIEEHTVDEVLNHG